MRLNLFITLFQFIDTATNTVIATIPVGIFPNPLTDNPFYRHELTKLYTLPNF